MSGLSDILPVIDENEEKDIWAQERTELTAVRHEMTEV